MNIGRIDKTVGKLMLVLEDPTLDLGKKKTIKEDIECMLNYRQKLVEKKNPIMPEVVTGFFGLAGILLVLYYEKTDIVISKAFMMAQKMTRG